MHDIHPLQLTCQAWSPHKTKSEGQAKLRSATSQAYFLCRMRDTASNVHVHTRQLILCKCALLLPPTLTVLRLQKRRLHPLKDAQLASCCQSLATIGNLFMNCLGRCPQSCTCCVGSWAHLAHLALLDLPQHTVLRCKVVRVLAELLLPALGRRQPPLLLCQLRLLCLLFLSCAEGRCLQQSAMR